MRAGIVFFILLILGPAGIALGNPETAPHFISYGGEALASSGQFLYSEHHVLKYRDGRLLARTVLYSCKDGSPFARKIASYGEPLAPDFLLEDSSTGMREGVRSSGGSRTVFFRAGRELPEKEAALEVPAGLVIDSGFDEFIRAHWELLMTGRAISMQFLVPSRLSGLGFQIQRLRGGQDGAATEVFRLRISGALGWVFPGIDVSYSSSEHLLVRYEGLSDLRSQSGDNLRTKIVFRPEDRRAADAQAFVSASQAALAPCKG